MHTVTIKQESLSENSVSSHFSVMMAHVKMTHVKLVNKLLDGTAVAGQIFW